jgi:hypothetical protein
MIQLQGTETVKAMPGLPLAYYIHITLKYHPYLGHPIVYNLENLWKDMSFDLFIMLYIIYYLLSVLVFLLFSVFNFAILLLGETSHYGEDAQSKVLEAISLN